MRSILRSVAMPAAVTATLLLGACQNMGMAPMQQKSLYERLGGQGAIVAVVDDFVGNVAADNRINKFFGKTDIPRLKRLLVEQICAGTGGPCTYTGQCVAVLGNERFGRRVRRPKRFVPGSRNCHLGAQYRLNSLPRPPSAKQSPSEGE